jgi:D-3-phosphoglycerate dehydrogenase
VLLRMPHVLATPHLGYVEKDSYELYFSHAFRNLAAFFAGGCQAILNPDYRKHLRIA